MADCAESSADPSEHSDQEEKGEAGKEGDLAVPGHHLSVLTNQRFPQDFGEYNTERQIHILLHCMRKHIKSTDIEFVDDNFYIYISLSYNGEIFKKILGNQMCCEHVTEA